MSLRMDTEHPCRAWLDDRLATEAECMAYFLLTGDSDIIQHFEVQGDGDRPMLEYVDGSKREASILEVMLSNLVQIKRKQLDTP